MANVVQKAVDANDIEQGNAVATVSPQGTVQALERYQQETNSLTKLNAILATRFDNPTYYDA